MGELDFPATLSAPRFFALAARTPVYSGAMALAAQQRFKETEGDPIDQSPPVRPAATGSAGGKVDSVEATPLNLRTHPVLSSVIEYG